MIGLKIHSEVFHYHYHDMNAEEMIELSQNHKTIL